MQNNIQVVIPQSSQVDTGKNVLYLSDLPHNILESDITMFFEDFKDKIVVMNINQGGKHYDSATGKPCSAKVIFKDSKAANEARKAKNMHKIKGKTIRVMWDERDNSLRYSSGANIFIKNIPFAVKPREFFEAFLKFGDISSSKLPEDENGHLGYGYINYYDQESAARAIKATDGKELWGSKLEVTFFQKKNERHGVYANTNNSIYVKNFPSNYGEKELKELCQPFGEVLSCKISIDDFGRRSAIVSFVNEDSSMKAKTGLNNKNKDGCELFVDILMNKQERKKILYSKIMDSNYKLNEQYKYCNLHIRNIPYHAKEEDLAEVFKKYGEIKSVKIEKYMLVTKENGELKEIPTSKGFGYVCFERAEDAKKAADEMNERYLPKFETWKRPLIIEFFMPKQERTPTVVNKINQTNSFSNQKIPMMNMFGGNMNMNMNPNMKMMNPNLINPNFNPNMVNPNMMNSMMNPKMITNPNFHRAQQAQNLNKKQKAPILREQPKSVQEKDELDYNYFNSLDYDSKKDYLGEYIFKKIENHKLSQANVLTIDTIGKITGMILGIEDINEIIDIYRNPENLTSRISEALELINSKN